jgi:hypothetical protein
LHLSGEIFGSAVGVGTGDRKLLFRTQSDEGHIVRRHADAIQPGRAGAVVGRAVPNPVQDGFIFERAGLESFAAAVRDSECRLLQDEALGRRFATDPAAVLCLDDGLIVEVGLVPEQGQLESCLAANRSVAIGVGASGFRKNRDDVFYEAQLWGLIRRRAQRSSGYGQDED